MGTAVVDQDPDDADFMDMDMDEYGADGDDEDNAEEEAPISGWVIREASKDRRRTGVLIDEVDGVRRCVKCTWEVVEGICSHCGKTYSDVGEVRLLIRLT